MSHDLHPFKHTESCPPDCTHVLVKAERERLVEADKTCPSCRGTKRLECGGVVATCSMCREHTEPQRPSQEAKDYARKAVEAVSMDLRIGCLSNHPCHTETFGGIQKVFVDNLDCGACRWNEACDRYEGQKYEVLKKIENGEL